MLLEVEKDKDHGQVTIYTIDRVSLFQKEE